MVAGSTTCKPIKTVRTLHGTVWYMEESSGFALRNTLTSTDKVKCKPWEQIYSEPGALPTVSPLLLHPPGGVGGHLWCPSRLITPSLLPVCCAAIKSRSRRRRRRWEEAGSGGCLLCRQQSETGEEHSCCLPDCAAVLTLRMDPWQAK